MAKNEKNVLSASPLFRIVKENCNIAMVMFGQFSTA